MFIDQITIHAKAGKGGNGVVLWLHEKGKEFMGPALWDERQGERCFTMVTYTTLLAGRTAWGALLKWLRI